MEDKKIVIIGIIISIIFVIIGCLWLSISAETLDKIAEELEAEESPIWNPPLPDYELPGFEGNLTMNMLISISFTFIIFLISFGLGRFLRKKDHGHSN